MLWFVVNAKEPQIELVPVRFTPRARQLARAARPVPQLQAIVAGSPKQLIKLSSNPPVDPPADHAPIRRTRVVLDLRPDDVTLPDGVDAVVRDVQPRSVTLRFESTWTRKVPRALGDRRRDDAATADRSRRGSIPTSVASHGTAPSRAADRVGARRCGPTIPFPDSLPHLVDIDTTGFGAAFA